MLEKIKNMIKRLFTDEKFTNRPSDIAGGKKIGEVYNINYMPDPEEPGHMILVFSKKKQEEG